MSANMEESIKENCFGAREAIESLKKEVIKLMKHPDFMNEQSSDNQFGEMKANIMLTYRHLEDARMRLGKVVQAYDGGQSALPR